MSIKVVFVDGHEAVYPHANVVHPGKPEFVIAKWDADSGRIEKIAAFPITQVVRAEVLGQDVPVEIVIGRGKARSK